MRLAIEAVDAFAGAGGWDVAAERIGIRSHGIEYMPEALLTREANGLRTTFLDVWHGLDGTAEVPPHELYIGSPPCQPFSPAGRGAGRLAFDALVQLIDERAYLDVAKLRAFAAEHDDKIALLLTPLAYVARHLPTYVVLEQVPTVKPVWDRMAVELRRWGYSVAVETLSAEQYGVPQTRRRAILIARADGVEATMPAPTHSRYYSRDPERLDPGVLPWVSMAEALGWGFEKRPSVTITGKGTFTRNATGTKAAIVAAADAGTFTFRPPYTAETARKPGPQRDDYLSLTDRFHVDAVNPTPEEAGVLQTFPIDLDALAEKVRERANDQSGTPFDPTWPAKRPALTVAGRGLVPHPGATANRYNGSTKSRNDGIKIAEGEAAALQSFPAGFMVEGSSDASRFLQIGNAVPPLLAEAVLLAATRRP